MNKWLNISQLLAGDLDIEASQISNEAVDTPGRVNLLELELASRARFFNPFITDAEGQPASIKYAIAARAAPVISTIMGGASPEQIRAHLQNRPIGITTRGVALASVVERA